MSTSPPLFTPVSVSTASRWQVFTDGGARGNPGPAASAFIIYNHLHQPVVSGGQFIGSATNNVAEYTAVQLAIEQLTLQFPSNPPPLLFKLDSKLVCEQLLGHYKIKQPHLQVLASTINRLVDAHHLNIVYVSIPRSQNVEADALVNQILDNPSDFPNALC